MKYKHNDYQDKEKKIHRVVKNNKVAKHKKSIYNMLSEEDDVDFETDSIYGELEDNNNKSKLR